MKATLLNLLFIGFLFASCNGQTNVKYESIPAVNFAEKIKATPQPAIIDVRSPEEFAGQHINNAININWNGDNFESKISAIISEMSPKKEKKDLPSGSKEITIEDMIAMRNSLSDQSNKEFENESSPD